MRISTLRIPFMDLSVVVWGQYCVCKGMKNPRVPMLEHGDFSGVLLSLDSRPCRACRAGGPSPGAWRCRRRSRCAGRSEGSLSERPGFTLPPERPGASKSQFAHRSPRRRPRVLLIRQSVHISCSIYCSQPS